MDFPVYIDTSLGHNFVMLVSDSDTVHDVKGKILLEYANCFPEMGEINAHAIKIDHRGTLYRLSESVLVGKVFEATIGARLLHVDASSTDPKYNEVRRSKDFLINSKECRDRNPTMLRIENNASHLLQCVPDIPCHSNRDGNSSGVIFDQNVHMVSDSPKKKSKRTKSIIGASGVGTSQSECGKGIDVSKVQKGMDYSYDLYKNVRQNASIKQGNNSSKRKDCGQQSDLQIDGQSDPRKKRHRREDVHTKFDIDKPQVACKEILSKKSEENIFDRTNDPIVKQNNIDLTSLNTPKERKKKKKSSGVSHKQKYNSETTSSHLTLQVANNDRSKHRKKKKKGKHSDNVEVKNILIAADNVEKSLADENGDPVIPMKNKSDTLTISSLETKNALAVSEKVNKEICRQLETPTSEFPLEKEQVISFAEESAMNENSKELVLTSPLDAKAQSNDLETPGFRTIASLPQKISSLPENLGAIGFQEDVDLVIPSEDDVSTAPLVNNDRSKRRKKKKKGKHSDNVEVKNILVAADNVEKSLADENGDSDIPIKNKSDTITVSSLETKNALAISEKVNKEICRQLETPTSEFPLEKEQVIPVAEESAMNENSIKLVLTSPLDAKAQSNDLETPGFRTIASLSQKISSLPESLGTIGFQEDVDLVIPSEDDVSTAPLVNNDRSKRRKKKKKGKHSDNVEVKNILVAADNVEKSLADENGDSDIPMKNKSDTITVSSLETKNALAVSEKVNKEICRLLETPTSEFPLEKEQVIPVAEESAMNENSIELVLTSPLDAKAQSNDLETPGFRTIASLPQKISSLPESLGTIDFQEDVDLVIPSEDDVSTAPLANNDRSKRRKKKKKGKHSDNVEVKNILVAADNVEKSLADENGDSDIPMKNKSDAITVSSLETKNALAVSEMVNKEICRQLETPTSEFPLKKEQVIPVAEESAMNENSIELVLMSPLDAKAQSNDLETPGFRTIASLPQKISSLPESLGAIGFQEDVDLVIPSEDDVSTASLVNKDKSKHCKKKKGKHSDNVKAKNILVAADNVEKLLADENRDSAIPMKSTKNTLSVSSLETKTALAAAENVIEKICRQIETPTSEFPFEKEKVILGGESVMDENSTELVLTSPSDAKMRPVVGEEVNFAEFFLPDVAVAKKKPTVSPEDSGNRKSEIKNRHIFKSKHRELQEEFTTKEELIGGEDENMQRIAKSKRDVENSNMSMQVTVPHRNVHIPCESTHTSKETNLTGIQTRKRSTKSSDKKVHGGVLLSDLEPRELIDNKSHKVKGKASPVNKKTERTKSNSSRKSNSNLAVYSDDVGKETKDSLSVFDSKTKGRNDCYRIAFRKVSGGLLEILENSKTEKPLPFDSLSIFDHISDNVAKDKDTDNSKRQFDFSSSSSDSDSEISDVNETQTVHLHASQPFKESHGIHKSECISGDKSGNREILRHVTTGSQASGQEMKLGAILRNSRSYKKAKLVASQTPAEETEPESLL